MAGTERVIYFHGVPGGAGELKLFGADISKLAAHFYSPDSSIIDNLGGAADHFRNLADTIKGQFGDEPLRLVGFSLGASMALRVAPFLGDQVREIDLISAAAPLDLGDYWDGMAGAAVFRLAKNSPFLFRTLSQMQSLGARVAPQQLFKMLFASAKGADLDLVQNAEFRAVMVTILRRCMGGALPAYIRDIELFTQDWSEQLDQVSQPVRLFHGRKDSWAPVIMAQDLAARLKQCEDVHLFDGLSHYSTLREYLASFSTLD